MNDFRVFFRAARVAAAVLFCAGGAALAQENVDDGGKAGKFEVEIGGTLLELSESVVNTPSVTLRAFVEALTLSAGAPVAPVNEVIATATLFSQVRAPDLFPANGTLTFSAGGAPFVVSAVDAATILHNGRVLTITANIRANTVSFLDAQRNTVTVLGAGDSALRYDGTAMTTEMVGAALTVLAAGESFAGFMNGSLRGCQAETDSVGGVGGSGRFYLLDDFVDVSLEGGFYATVQKGAMELRCRLEEVDFGGVSFTDDRGRRMRDIQTARVSKAGEWSANSVFLGLRVEDEFGPLLAYFRVGGNYWTREYSLARDFNVDGLHYTQAENGRDYYIPAPTLRWRGPEGILSEETQDGFSSHFAFGARFGRLSAGWSRNKQDDFRVDAYQFSYNHEF